MQWEEGTMRSPIGGERRVARLALCAMLASAGARAVGTEDAPTGRVAAHPTDAVVATPLVAAHGWRPLPRPIEHIPEAEQAELWTTIRRNIARLEREGRLPTKAATSTKFGWPTRFALGRSELLDHAIAYYVDEDAAVDSVRDFNCGVRSYDTPIAGGGHKGTDISLGPRSFYKMDTEQVVVVAAADGTIVQKDDTNPDRSCGDLSALFANPVLRNNVIAIRHADGTVAIYYHVKTGSLTPKRIGDAVVEGEYLGAVGSSGFSSGPHLHFEVRTAANAVVDPWLGSCNPSQAVSWWKAQEPYLVQEIMSLMPTSTAPTVANTTTACTNNVADNETAADYLQPDFHAQPGVVHHFVAFLRDVGAGDSLTLALRRPDGTVLGAFTLTASGYASTSYAFMSRAIPASEPAGRWSFEATYAGKTKSVPFWFDVKAPSAARVYEFYNATLDHYFRTAAKAEADSLGPTSGFLPTGDDFLALDRTRAGLAGAMPVCRFYGSTDPGPNSHFYTADPAECQALEDIQARTPASQPRWNYEETAFSAFLPVEGLCPQEAPFPIYRLYNGHVGETVKGVRADSNHRFTTLSSTYYRMAGAGWRGEGVVMCAGAKP
jgi:murein DD-endopeptidase MepM/ murein hydrolase activator NlpD